MSQVSYGTITITDTNDIERIYIEYCRSTSNQLDTSVMPPIVPDITVNWSENTPAWQSGEYIWQRSVVKKSGISDLVYGTPVCLTGAGGRSIEEIKTFYCNYGTGTPAEDYDGWSVVVPEYVETKPYYWIKTVIIYVDDSKEERTYTGNPIVIDDADGEVKTLNVELTPIQEGTGTPSPTNIRPITPHTSVVVRDTGKNLWGGLQMAQDIQAVDSGITIDEQAKTVTYSGSMVNEKTFISGIFKANTQYTLILKGSNATSPTATNVRVIYSDNVAYTMVFSNGVALYQTVAGKTVDRIEGVWYSGTTVLNYDECGLFEGVLTASDFTPYTGQTVTVPLNDLYGGTVDVIGGASKDSWKQKIFNGSEQGWLFIAKPNNPAQSYAYNRDASLGDLLTAKDILSSYIPTVRFSAADEAQGIYVESGYLWVRTASMQSMTLTSDWTSYLADNPLQTVYEPATPLDLITTPTPLTLYKGDNVVSSDGNMTLDYYSIAGRDIQIHLDNGLTEAIAQSVEANSNATKALDKANEANSVAQHANEDAQGAMSQAAATQVAQEALASRLKRIWSNYETEGNYLAGTYAASGINGVTFAENNPSSYGFNSLLRHNYLSFRYNTHKLVTIGTGVAVDSDSAISGVAINVPILTNNVISGIAKGMELSSGALKFYHAPTISGSTVTDGSLAMELTGSALNFYGSSTSTTDAILNSNGLTLSKGGIISGSYSSTSTNFLYLSSTDYSGSPTITIGGNSSGWRQIIGSKFGVKNDGTLYASNAVISGQITVTSGSDLSVGLSDYYTADEVDGAVGDAITNLSTSISNTYATQTSVSSTYATKTEAVVKEQRIYRRFTSAQSTFSGLNTWINSGDGYTTWSTSIPQLTNGTTPYPFLYMSTQTQTATQAANNGTNCSYTPPQLNAMTTVIDGDSIIANSISAGKINVSNLEALSANLGGWTIEEGASSTYGGAIYKNTFGQPGGIYITPGYTYNGTAIGVLPTGQTWTITAGNQFGVTTAGKLYANGADITGEIKADTGRIGGTSGWTIASQQISSGSIGADNSMYLSTKNLAGTVAGKTLTTTAPSWRLTVGSNFGVDNTGKLYATGADISGKITVGSGSDLSAGLTNYSTTSQMNTAIGNATNDMATNAKTDWLVEVTTTGIPDFVTPSVTLKAIVYHRGVLTTSGFTRAWYKNGTGNSLGGEETVTVSDMDAYYVCIISETN